MANVAVTIATLSTDAKGVSRTTETIFNLKISGAPSAEEHSTAVTDFKARVIHALDTLLKEDA